MTEEERKTLLLEKAQIQARLAKAEGKPLPKATLKGQDEEVFAPSKTAVSPLSTLLNQSVSGKVAASKNILPSPKAKARPVNAPDTGATSLVTNKVKTTPTRTAPTRTPASATPPSRLSYTQAQKALAASEGGKPAKGLEAVDKAFKESQRARESKSPTALDEQFAADLALKRALGESTMKGRTAEQLRQGEVLRQGRGTPYVAPDTAQKDLEAAVITTLLGIAPGVGGQLAVGAASKLIPEATQVARPMLSNMLRGGAAIGGAVGTAKLQDVALEGALGTPQYEKMQQDMAAFQGRQPLLTAMLQGGAGAIMQRPSLAASLGERLVGAGMGAGLSVGGDIMAGQPIDFAKAGTEALANVAFAGPNTKAGDVLETAGGRAVNSTKKAIAGVDMSQVMPDSPYVQRTITKQQPPRIEDVPLSSNVSFVNPNAPVESPTAVKPVVPKTSAQAPSKPKVVVPMGEAGTLAPESLISTTPTTRKGKATESAPPVDNIKSSGRSFDDASTMSMADMEAELSSLVTEQTKRKSQASNLNAGGRETANNPYQERIKQLQSEMGKRRSSAKDVITSLDVASEQELREALATYTHELNTLQSSGKTGAVVDSVSKKVARIEETINNRFPSISSEAPPVSDGTEFDMRGTNGKTTESAPPPVEPVKQTGDLLTRPSEPVKETSKSIQVEEPVAPVKSTRKGKPTKPSEIKEPWLMTKTEWDDARSNANRGQIAALKAMPNSPYQDSLSWAGNEVNRLQYGTEPELRGREKIPVYSHEAVVRKALSEGKPVPPEVLADYPELAAKYGKTTESTPALQSEPKLETAEPTAPKPEPLTPARKTILAREVQSALADVNAPDKPTSEAARARLTNALDTLRADGAIKGEGVKLTDAITDRESFRKSVQEAFNLPDDQADEVANLVDDWAHGWAKKNDATPADFYATVKGIHSFDDDLAQLVLGTGAKTAKGARLPEQNVIAALKRGDVSTAVHEMAHHFLDTLPDTARQKVMDSFPGATKENAHELFAKGFEAGLKDPNSPLHRFYKKFKSWLDDVYGKSIAQWRKATDYVEGGLRVQEDRNGKKVVSFVTGLPKDAHDIVMDYLDTGVLHKLVGTKQTDVAPKGSTAEGGVAPKSGVPTETKGAGPQYQQADGVKPIRATDVKERYEDFKKFAVDNPNTYETPNGNIVTLTNRRDSGQFFTLNGKELGWNMPESYSRSEILREIDNLIDSGKIKAPKPIDFVTKNARQAQPYVAESIHHTMSFGDFFDMREKRRKEIEHFREKSRDYTPPTADDKAEYERITGRMHRKAVSNALLFGIDVPKEVLADYPDLEAKYGKSSEPQFQQSDDEGTTTIFDVPLKNAAIQGFFNIDEKTLQLKTTVKAEMQSALDLAQSEGFAQKVIKQVLNGENVLTPDMSAQNIVVAAEASKRRAKWESLKNSDAPQSKVDEAYNDYMKMLNASYLLGRKAGLALRMRQEMVATADPLDPDSYIARAAGMYTGNLSDPEFKAFVERVTAKSATARQSHESLMSEVDRLSKAYDESQAALAQANTDKATLEAEKKKIEDQLFSKKPPKTTEKPKEAPSTAGGTTAPKPVSNLSEKVRKTGYERGDTKLKTESSDEAISASKQRALSGLDRLKALAQSKKFQFQQDDDITDIDDDVSGSISEGRQALIDIGQGLLASGTRNFKTWKEEISGFLGEAGIDDLEDHQYQVLWVDSKISLRDEVPDMNTGVKKSSIAGTTIQKVIGSLSLEGAQSWLDNISDQDGNPVIFEKLVKGQDLTPAELDVAARAWMVVQKAQGQRVSNRGKVGAIEDIKRVAREIKAQETKAVKQTEYVPLTSEQGAEIVRKALARVRTVAQEKKANDPVRQTASEVLASVRRLQANSVGHQSQDVVNGIVDKALGQFESGSVDDAKATLKQALTDVALIRKQARMAKTQAKANAPFDQVKAEERIQKTITGLTENAKSRPAVDPLKRSAGEVVAAITRTKTALEGKAPISEVVTASEQALALYKSGDLEGAKKVLTDLRAKYPTARTDITMDAALESISKMTEGLGEDKANTQSPVMRARLARFNGAIKALAKRYIGDGQGQLTATEFKSLVEDATKQFKDAGTDVEKHQQVLRDLRSNTLRGVGLDPNVRYKYMDYKSDADAIKAVKAKVDNEGRGLAELVKDYALGRKVSQPNPLLDLATVEYARAGDSVIAWAKAVENRWGKTLGDAERKKLYNMAAAEFFAMSDPNDPQGIPYAIQTEGIKHKMNLETERLVFNKKSWLERKGIELVESGQAMTGNVASFDYSFGGHQGGASFIFNPYTFGKSLGFGVKATGIQSLRGGPSLEQVALAWDKKLAAEMNDTYGDPQYYKKVNLALGDSAFADTYTAHGFISQHARDLADALSSLGTKNFLRSRADKLEKQGKIAAAEKLRARAESMRGPGERSESMNKMFIRNRRKDLFNQFTGNGEKYRALRMELEKAPDQATKEVLEKKLYALDQYNKVIGEVVSILTGHGTADNAKIRGFLTGIGRWGGIWSPTFMLSRFQGLTAYPTIRFLAHARQHAKNGMTPAQILHAAAIPLAVQQVEIQALNGFLWLMSQLPGVEILGQSDDEDKKTPWNWFGLDPMNTDYGKIRFLNHEFDVSAGFRKHYVAANRSYELLRNGLVNIVRASNKEVDEVLLTPMEKWVDKDAVASMRDFMYTHTAPPLPNKGEYDPYQRRITNPSEGLRFWDQYISSSLTPIAGLGYEVARHNALNFRREPITVGDIGWRLLTPIPVSSALHEAPTEKARREKEVKELGISKATELSDALGKDWYKNQVINSLVDIGGIGSDVRDRQLEGIIENARKYPSWSKYSELPPTKKQVELRTKIRQMIRDQQAFAMSRSGIGTYMPDKAVRQSADQMTRDMRIEQLSEGDLLKIYRDLKAEIKKKRADTPYMLSPRAGTLTSP